MSWHKVGSSRGGGEEGMDVAQGDARSELGLGIGARREGGPTHHAGARKWAEIIFVTETGRFGS